MSTTANLRTLDQSSKLKNVLYEIRGQALVEADRLESEGHRILKLNTGNPASFGFEAPFQIVRDMIEAMPLRARLLRQPRHRVGAARGRLPLRAGAGLPQGRPRRRLPRQRGLRAHHHDDAGAPRRGRRGPDPGTGLSAVDRDDEPRRRHPRALRVRQRQRLAARPRGHPLQGHAAHQGDRHHQPEQSDGRRLHARDARGPRRHRAGALAPRARRRDLRPHPVRRRRAHPDGDRRAGPPVPDVQRALQDLSRRRLPLGVARHHGPQAPRVRVPRGHHAPRVDAAVPQCPRAARRAGGALGRPVDRRADRAVRDGSTSSGMPRGRVSRRSPASRA